MARPRTRLNGALILTASALVAAACGSDSNGTGPEMMDVEFATLPPAVAQTWCVQGTVEAPNNVNGTLSDTDCLTTFTPNVLQVPVGFGPDTYFETWRVKVASSSTLTFTVSSGFDSYLDIYRLPDITDPATAVFITFDDDSGSDLNAQAQASLSPNNEYWVMVSGFEASETGPYTLTIN